MEEYKEHAADFPYVCIPYEDPVISSLQDALEIDAIPVVTLLKKNGTIAKGNVRGEINTKGVGCLNELKMLSN